MPSSMFNTLMFNIVRRRRSYMAAWYCTGKHHRFPIWTGNPFLPFLVSQSQHKHRRVTAILKCMAAATARSSSGSKKRSICPSCLKPSRTCLCTRIVSPGLDNSVGITILQHRLEKKHPLNSTRIVKLGLKNVVVAVVSDVIFDAQFSVWSLEEEFVAQNQNNQIRDSESLSVSELSKNLREEIHPSSTSWRGADSRLLPISGNLSGKELKEPVINITVGKKGLITSLQHFWTSQIHHQKTNFDEILSLESARNVLSKGFVVRKLQKSQVNQSMELEESEEFKLTVPPGSVLLFPSETSLTIDELKASGFEVKNVIALDGTWSKARRMYSENPWLRMLPQLKLDPKGRSLYGEVRSQPKSGYLSTLESIVYTLKGVDEENAECLDNLLGVFESMVNDQRQCKNDRLSQDE